MEENKEFSNKKECKNCGKCCTNILLLRTDEIDKIHKYITKNRIKPNNKNLVLSPLAPQYAGGGENTNHNISYVDRCPFLTDDNQCSIYSVRPQICKTFFCSSFCEGEIQMNYKNVRAISMLQTFFPEEYCPDLTNRLIIINNKIKSINKKIYK